MNFKHLKLYKIKLKCVHKAMHLGIEAAVRIHMILSLADWLY